MSSICLGLEEVLMFLCFVLRLGPLGTSESRAYGPSDMPGLSSPSFDGPRSM